MLDFPSVAWFQAVADLVNKDDEYRRSGHCDAEVGVQVGDRLFHLSFDAFDVTGVREVTGQPKPDLDFSLVLPPDRWQAMIENIKLHGRAELEHTLNTIDLSLAEGFALSDDGYRLDVFHRFNQSFQRFFDLSARLDTRFPAAASA